MHNAGNTEENKNLKHLDYLANLMDTRFRIPGTDIRFGLDALLGLIPGAGDLSTFAVSGYLIWMMANKGASGYVLARMILNVLIDTVIGSIPLIGDLFDIAFKANTRNMKLMRRHYGEGKYNGSAWKVIFPVLLVLLVVVIFFIWVAWQLFEWIYNLIF